LATSPRRFAFFSVAILLCFAALTGAVPGWSGNRPASPVGSVSAFALFFLVGLVVAWHVRKHPEAEKRQLQAIRPRPVELDSERRIERARNEILEMLVSNEPLDVILDATVRLIQSQIPAADCAILLRRPRAERVSVTPGFPEEWLAALSIPYAVPFEVWRSECLHREIPGNPAWKVFNAQLYRASPREIYSLPIGGPSSILGALLLCYREGRASSERDPGFAATGARLARLALEHHRLYHNLHFEAHHDSLTGLPNRALFEERLETSLLESAVMGRRLAVLFIDMDGFKQINDSFSHRFGDRFLCEIAARMKKAMRPGDIIARIGGDEFTVLAEGIAGIGEAEAIGERILHAVRQPVVIHGREVAASASIGIAAYPEDGNSAEELLRHADAAMYSAKDCGRSSIQPFARRNGEMDRFRMNEQLKLALENDGFVVYYQPKVGVDGALAGLEALVRMKHPEYGQIPPVSFISVAEANGLIVPLGTWVLEEVCRQSAEWKARGLGRIPIAVNVSPVQISRSEFARMVEDCLARHAVPPSSIELELTESLLLGGAHEPKEQMRALRSLGVRLSIDDFGTGYSSLSYLHRLHVDAIKLDKSFVQAIDTDELACRLVKAMIGVAQGLGLTVVAEGVETQAQRATLIAAGCLFMQGFLFAHPLPAAEIETLLRRPMLPHGDLMNLNLSLRELTAMAVE
jgi:diguanylate cyclase (GGDEF)-like protein